MTAVRGDTELKERVQLYLTPRGEWEACRGWDLRAEIQLPHDERQGVWL